MKGASTRLLPLINNIRLPFHTDAVRYWKEIGL